jgi:hypothetical protein
MTTEMAIMQYGKPNLNEGKPWSEMDLVDLRNSLALGSSVAYIADFLCRSEGEVHEKIAELQRTMGVSLGRREG